MNVNIVVNGLEGLSREERNQALDKLSAGLGEWIEAAEEELARRRATVTSIHGAQK